MKYTAINIGPIAATLSMAKRPRELWSASYLFSHLMSCIIEALPNKLAIISPSTEIDLKVGVGLYPDRVFIKGDISINDIIKKASENFSSTTHLSIETVNDYFNIAGISMEANSDKVAIKELNQYLNYWELNNKAINESSWNAVYSLIKNQYRSPLFSLAFSDETNKKSAKFNIGTLGEIATYSLSKIDNAKWKEARALEQLTDEIYNTFPEEYKIVEEDLFYQKLKEDFKDVFKSHHKYICIVQADGDNMGTVVSNAADDEVKNISQKLLNFGKDACALIREYGGIPIYAGGDDLLFIAPVYSIATKKQENGTIAEEKQNIFNLLSSIDGKYSIIQTEVDNLDTNSDEKLHTAMSYGVSMTYYKYPLYEALASAQNSLFGIAKQVEGKNAIAWNLQKHSGSSFVGKFSKKTDTKLYKIFQTVIATTNDENLVTAVAHKIRANEGLLALWAKEPSTDTIRMRINAFFEKAMDINHRNEPYIRAVIDLLCELYTTVDFKDLIPTAYGILRTAKFINGEEDNQ